MNAVAIDLSVNNFSGSIPASLADCKSLEQLNLSFNNLTGTIPSTLGNLPELNVCNVSYNRLEGPIPDTGAFQANISAASFLGNPELCGSILPTKCPSAAQLVGHSSCRGFQCRRVWLSTASAAAALTLITVATFAALLPCIRRERQLCNSQDLQVPMFSNILKLTEKDILDTIDKEANVIGAGARSVVYRGTLPDGEVFAAKVLRVRAENMDDEEQSAGARELIQEVRVLAKLRHRNIVRVCGYFSSLDLKAIILEYVPRGTLEKHLYGGEVCELTWAMRLNIAVGVAEGLVYLHEYSHQPIIHRDLKPSNVFLDESFEPKLGDFGISKFVNPERSGEATASTFCGTTGYAPPEYGTSIVVSTKADVYSFGIILLELLTRKQPPGVNGFGECQDLVGRARAFQDQPSVLFDSGILPDEAESRSSKKLEQMNLLVRVGLLCTQASPQNRPAMGEVMSMLNQIKVTGSPPASYTGGVG